jgi:GTP pyrophosphokinase
MIRFNDILEKLSSSYSEKDLGLLRKAYVFAASAHKGQVRRSGEPYLSHPLEVANMLADIHLDTTTLAAGLLHDVLEDTDVTAPEIHAAFGKDIAHLVEGVTKISLVQESSPETRQAESIQKIILAMTDDLRVISIATRLGMGRIKAELEDLAFRFVDPEKYFKINSLVEPKRMQAEKELKKHRKTIEILLAENNLSAEISYRLKRPYSIHRKMKQQDIYFDQVYDFMALRLILNRISDCYAALGIIHQKWPHLPHRFHDFISMPKPNLYQSLHTTIMTEKKQMIEIQIRTQEMHDLAENGISAHWRYKDPDPKSKMKDDKRLLWLREMVEMQGEQKSPRAFLKSLKTGLVPEEVFVYTPKGKTMTLPLGASALDFAFKIHSEIGLHAVEAKVNGRTTPLKTFLKAGDVVEIITSLETTPDRRWLNMVFTPTAKHHLKHWLNLQDKTKNTELGQKLWEKETKK